MDAKIAPATANGHKRIARPAKGTHRATNDITGTSTMIPITEAIKAPGI